jgi:hypothetical protein
MAGDVRTGGIKDVRQIHSREEFLDQLLAELPPSVDTQIRPPVDT